MSSVSGSGDKLLELITAILVGALLVLSILSIYGPSSVQGHARVSLPFVLIGIAICFAVMALTRRLLFKMGLRNLVRHRGDSAIAIIGFMIGTAIICSSLVIGDTLTSLVGSLIYERYHLVDEVVYLQDQRGNSTIFNGSQANEMRASILSSEGSRGLIDGISFEFRRSVSVIDMNTQLLEPSMSMRAFSPDSVQAFGALYEGGSRIPLPLETGTAALSKGAADKLGAEPGHTIIVSTGYSDAELKVAHVLDKGGRSDIFGGENIFVSFDTAWSLFEMEHDPSGPHGSREDWSGGAYNILFISNKGGVDEGGRLSKKMVPIIDLALSGFELEEGVLKVQEDKGSGYDSAIEGVSLFIKVFVSLSAFSVVAGMTLIVNIFIMLSEERMEEMGISRAIGMRRSGLRQSYMFEGLFYSLISSLMGVIVGIAAGYLIIFLLEKVIASAGIEREINILSNYTILPGTLLLSFMAGFGITLLTTFLVTNRIARLNIVSAIRGMDPSRPLGRIRTFLYSLLLKCEPEHVRSLSCNLPRWISIALEPDKVWGVILLISGIASASAGVSLGILWPLQIGVSVSIVGAALLVRRSLGDRAVFTGASILILVWWLAPLPFTNDLRSDIEMFFFSGIFMVTSGAFIIVWNTELFLVPLRLLLRIIGISPAPIKMAVSYPLKKKFRTGVTIFMFALVIFTITGLTMVVHIFNVNIDEFERSTGGGYDIIGISNTRGIPDLASELNLAWGEERSRNIDWDSTTSLSIGFASINISMGPRESIEMPYLLCGISDAFIHHNTYGFNDVAWEILGSRGISSRSDEAVWGALSFDDLVIVDGTIGENDFGPPGLGLSAGSEITILLSNGTRVQRTIIAITDQFAIRAVFLDESRAAYGFNVTEKIVHMIKVAEGEDPTPISDELRKALLPYGFITIVVRDLVREILSFQNNIFDLFNAYLSLGLIIGIVGLGIVTLRSVYERRHEIGMLRAIGFRKRAVVATFLGESTFIASSGLILGSSLGVLLGWKLWRDEISSELPEFGIPYTRILIILSIAFAFALMSSIPPSNMASKVAPAEALRYE
ncbi:MAG: FtsX-like permease family protein [Candidatus Thermoplasmatota archaeon]|nr:FtsX-like permease family protein [Candidatus Thermoplasmatota archaeon]